MIYSSFSRFFRSFARWFLHLLLKKNIGWFICLLNLIEQTLCWTKFLKLIELFFVAVVWFAFPFELITWFSLMFVLFVWSLILHLQTFFLRFGNPKIKLHWYVCVLNFVQIQLKTLRILFKSVRKTFIHVWYNFKVLFSLTLMRNHRWFFGFFFELLVVVAVSPKHWNWLIKLVHWLIFFALDQYFIVYLQNWLQLFLFLFLNWFLHVLELSFSMSIWNKILVDVLNW